MFAYVYGEETIHLTMGSKKKIGHFVCEDKDAVAHELRECSCRILVGGRATQRLDMGGVALLRTCRRV